MLVTVRKWKAEDVERIAEIEKRCFADPWSAESLADVLKYPYYDALLAEENGNICAYACWAVLFEDAELMNIAVDEPYRRQGHARSLMELMHISAKSNGAMKCFLEVRKSNYGAIRLYESYGYKVYGERKRYYGDGEDALLMKKSL